MQLATEWNHLKFFLWFEHFISCPPRTGWDAAVSRAIMQHWSLYKMHADSWAALGSEKYYYFSGSAIEQQHGAITNIFFVNSPLASLIWCTLSHSRHISCTCGCHKNHVCLQLMQTQTNKQQKTVRRGRWCIPAQEFHVYLIRRHIKKEILFSTSKATGLGNSRRLSAFPTLSTPFYLFHQ